MPRPFRPAIALMVASATTLALHAQSPSPTPSPTSQPTAKQVVESVKKQEAESKSADPIERIKEEGLQRSQVMATLGYLTEVIGPRLNASPAMKRANEWTRDKLAGWGLENAHLEPWGPIGRGWVLERFAAQVVEPRCIPLIAYPKAWSRGTDGPLTARVVLLDAESEADLAKFKGKLKGAIVLAGPPRSLPARFEPLANRLTDKQLLTLADAPEPGAGRTRNRRPPRRGSPSFGQARLRLLIDEGAGAILNPSGAGDGGTLTATAALVPGGPSGPQRRRPSARDYDAPATPPQIVVADEDYNRMARMIRQGESLTMTIDLAVRFLDDDPLAYNTVAEISGTDLKAEVVMLGGHLDSWHAATGATDNGAGVAAAMEAVRILQALHLKPRRTIRIALWSGEEQGLLGSRAYVARHFGRRRPTTDDGTPRPSIAEPETRSDPPATASRQAEYEHFSAYFNLDNGTGKIRGVYLQGNEAVRPIFRQWLAPFRDLGASTLTIANTGGTDHLSFDEVGLPAFQFIQDPLDYGARTHHTNQDVYDRIQADDLKQAAVVLAAFVYDTAMRDERLPRKPVKAPPTAVAATVGTTLETDSDQVRQLAFDGDDQTFFASTQPPSGDDHFTLTLAEPVAVESVRVTTGRPGGAQALAEGALEVSDDGRTFDRLARFEDGTARGALKGRRIRAIRIRPESGARHPLVIREIAIESNPTVATFNVPVEFHVDVSDAPEMKDWAEQTARTCERWYPRIAEELSSDGFTPPRRVTISLKDDYRGVAATGGDRIIGSVRYFRDHPDDVGAMIHEAIHVIQNYGSRNNPSWLVEGLADYIRFFEFEPGKLRPIDPDRARYDRSYRVTASFLAYLAENYDPEIIPELNALMRQGRYKEGIFRDLTGKSVRELDEEWRKALRR